MKNTFFLLACVALASCSLKNKEVTILLQNPLAMERQDEAGVLTRADLQPVSDETLPVVTDKDGKYVACQLDDLNKDGVWDELAFVYDIPANGTKELQVKWIAPADYPSFERRTNIRYGKMTSPGHIEELTTDLHDKKLFRGAGYPYQMDGVAWENDKMGFRHYYDGRNSRDVFGKRVSTMALDTVGIRPDGTPGDTYHVLSDWGRDIMSAANSFGLGGLAIQTPDTLLRLGVLMSDTVDIIDSTRYVLITEGPVRSRFSLDFYGWDVEGTKVDVHEEVTIWAGKFGYEDKIMTSALPADSYMVTGIVANNNDNEETKKQYRDSHISMITHDKQTYNKVWYMGMALILPSVNVVDTFDAPRENSDIRQTWCVKMKPDRQNEYNYNVYAAWELTDERFCDRDFFINLIDGYGERLASPVSMTFK